MVGGDSAYTCMQLFHQESHLFYAAPGVLCLGYSSDKSRGIYLRAAFMTAILVYPEAIIWGWLLQRPQLLTGEIRYVIKNSWPIIQISCSYLTSKWPAYEVHAYTCLPRLLLVYLPYMYKFSRHVNFEDVTNQAFLQFYFRGSPSILLSDSCKLRVRQWNFEDENFADGQFTVKTSKITSLKIWTYMAVYCTRVFLSG